MILYCVLNGVYLLSSNVSCHQLCSYHSINAGLGYMTPEQRALFGPFPTTALVPPSDSDCPSGPDHLRTLHRAVTSRNGPLFLDTLNIINALLRTLKYPPLPSDSFAPPIPNQLKEHVHTFAESGFPNLLAMRIIDETYQRAVGPHTALLAHYEAFSSNVYGELMPPLVARVLAQAGVRPGMKVVDLGAGVGNVVLQAALQTGCNAFGVEIMRHPSALARTQRAQMARRARMWGVTMGAVELEEGDMLASRRVDALLRDADVVLVNNKVFLESLNEALRPKFLDLKEGALVVSLKPFVSALHARVTERNVDDLSAIFDVQEHAYHSMDVSWGSGSGTYYVHRVDRAGYAAIRERFERSVKARSTRSRR